MNNIYEVYTDGACSNNQGSGGQPGGWGVVFLDGRQFSGYDKSTTNNRMELTAAIEALKNTPIESEVKLYSDSAYLINAFLQNWLINWKKNGWKTVKGRPVENQDLWLLLIKLESERKVNWIKVKGHSDNKWNNLADKLAVEAISDSKINSKDINNENEKIQDEINIKLSKENYDLLLTTIKKLSTDDVVIKQLYVELTNNKF